MFEVGEQVRIETVDRDWGNYSSRMAKPGAIRIVKEHMPGSPYGNQYLLSDGIWYKADWLKSLTILDPEKEDDSAPEYTGSSVSYYTVRVENPTTPDTAPYDAECNDIIEALDMNYAEGNAFKAIWRRAAARKGLKKKGYTDGLYDAEKVVFFGQRMVVQEKANASED